MEKRALIAVAISIFILLFYQEVVLRRFYPPPPEGETAVSAPPTTAPVAPRSAPDIPPEIAAPVRPQSEARMVTVETDLYRAVFTSAGARLQNFQLKKYRTTVDPNSPLQQMILPGREGDLPFGVELRGAQGLSDSNAPYGVEGGDLRLTAGEEGSLNFAWAGDGVTLRKRFAFRGDRYDFSATVSAEGLARQYNELAVAWAKGVATQPQPGSEVIFDHAIYLDGRKFTEDPFDKLSAGKIVPEKDARADIQWSGYAGKHFLAAMVPVEAQNERLWLKLRDSTVEEKLLFPIPSDADAVQQRLDIFIGPKDFDALERIGHNLSRGVNLGWFGFIAVPLLHVLQLSHTFTGNYGLDIILLTVIIKILFIPLTQRSFKSMRAMQKLQPQMAKIREKFKDTPEQMNKEIMELYRRHKVNPLGGCLPMLLQIPVFIGLYQALLNTVELRHAPFFLWINDLSAPDRLGSIQFPVVQHFLGPPGVPVLTLLMGVSMFVQQWMTPSAGDPAQQRVMMIMPVMFTFMFVTFPSGLVLYWLVNNLLTIAQQFYMNRTST
ncbi:MAG: yidC [Deltaproteobacteria bacterium]|nr:yidC [Deltaproteobacteria bacterium]